MDASIQISATPDRVWSVLSDIEHWPDWLPTVSSATWITDGPPGTGSRARLAQPRLGTAAWAVTEYAEGESFSWSRSAPGVTTYGTHEIAPTDDGCRVTLGLKHVGAFAGIARLITSLLARGYVATEAASLKERCEQLAERRASEP